MGLLHFLGTVLLSVVCSIVGNIIDRFLQNRRKKKSPTPPE